MEKKNSIKERAKKVPLEIKLMVSRSMATAKQISIILDKQGKTQKDLATLLGKKESEISKWLRGSHNFTFKTIAKIEAVLGEQIIYTANQADKNIQIYTVVISDNKEQPICVLPTNETTYLDVKNKSNYTFTKSISNVTKMNKGIDLSRHCIAN